MYVFDPSKDEIRHLGDLADICSEKGKALIAQDKSHGNFIKCEGKLYFASHIGYYSIVDGMAGSPDNEHGREGKADLCLTCPQPSDPA